MFSLTKAVWRDGLPPTARDSGRTDYSRCSDKIVCMILFHRREEGKSVTTVWFRARSNGLGDRMLSLDLFAIEH